MNHIGPILLVDDSGFAKALVAELGRIAEEMPDPQTPDEEPPKRNANGKRMATQPLSNRQNYLTMRNQRW